MIRRSPVPTSTVLSLTDREQQTVASALGLYLVHTDYADRIRSATAGNGPEPLIDDEIRRLIRYVRGGL